MALTREPSGRRASTIGDDSSMRRPSGATIRSMTRITCSLSRKMRSVSSILPEPLDVDLARAVDHHLVDGRIIEQRLDGTVAGHLVQDIVGDPLAVARAEAQAFLLHRLADQRPHAAIDLIPRQPRQAARVQLLHQALVQPRLQLDKFRRRHPLGQGGFQVGPRLGKRSVQGSQSRKLIVSLPCDDGVGIGRRVSSGAADR